jgi:hypothetical protein
VQSPTPPLVGAADASHELGTHSARDRLSQPTQWCSPTKLNPSPSHAGKQVDPGASESVHVPLLPPTMKAASHLPSARIHARGGPSSAAAEATNAPVDTWEHADGGESKPQLTYLAFHALASLNMAANVVTLDTSHVRTSCLNL